MLSEIVSFIGHWSLVIGHWSLVIGHWSLVIGGGGGEGAAAASFLLYDDDDDDDDDGSRNKLCVPHTIPYHTIPYHTPIHPPILLGLHHEEEDHQTFFSMENEVGS